MASTAAAETPVHHDPHHTPAERPLAKFLASAGSLSREDRQRIVDQAIVLLETFYVHLPLKKASYAIDPIQQLRMLSFRLDQIGSDWQFHSAMLRIFLSLGDMHTNYRLPAPFAGIHASLPFRVESCTENGRERFLVTAICGDIRHKSFVKGVEITHWNGVPIGRMVDIIGEVSGAANAEARHSWGAAGLTGRSLVAAPPAEEGWATISFIAEDGSPQRATFEWSATGLPAGIVDGLSRSRTAGYDLTALLEQQANRIRFAPNADGSADAVDNDNTTGDVFGAREVDTTSGRFGYIRIWSFNPHYAGLPDDAAYVQRFVDLLATMPETGLIIDVRDNGGGSINAAEMLLQTLTARTIEPLGFQMINTPGNHMLVTANGGAPGDDPVDSLAAWAPSIARGVETGAVFSISSPITTREKCNAIGQRYEGPVVLITSARCYSATDMFAAGFQDHQIGPVIGVHGCTGAGGANVWAHDMLMEELNAAGPANPLTPLPDGVGMRVAFRRAMRVGINAGLELENLGVVPDMLHRMTRNDILNGNADLIDAAGKLLAEQARHVLKGTASPSATGRTVAMTATGIDRVDVFVDDRPVWSVDVVNGAATADVAVPASYGRIMLKGYEAGQLRTVSIATETPAC